MVLVSVLTIASIYKTGDSEDEFAEIKELNQTTTVLSLKLT